MNIDNSDLEMMEERQFETNVVIPIIVVFLAICLGIVNWYKSEIKSLDNILQQQSFELDSLKQKYKELVVENEKLKFDTCQHIKLDVTGVTHKGGGVVVNNSMCK